MRLSLEPSTVPDALLLGILQDTGRRNSEFPFLQLNKHLLYKDRLLGHLNRPHEKVCKWFGEFSVLLYLPIDRIIHFPFLFLSPLILLFLFCL